MKKQLITVIVFIVILAGLLLTYFLVQNKRSAEDAASAEEVPGEEEKIVLIDKSKSDIQKITFENEKGVFTFVPNTDEDDEQEWNLVEYPKMRITGYAVDSMITSLYYLSPTEKLLDNVENKAEFGLDKPAVATAEYKDGSTVKIFIGKKTPSGEYYYIMLEGDPAVYLLIKTYGDKFYNGYNEIINREIPQINLQTLYYAYINEKGKTEIELKYPKSREEFLQEAEAYGAVYAEMVKPYQDMEVYINYFVEQLSTTFQTYSLSELVEINCADLSKYGLDDPELTIIMEDTEQILHLLVGNFVVNETEITDETDYVYVCFGGSNDVFKMKAEYFEAFRNINPLKFVQRFVMIPNIETVDALKIESSEYGRNHDIRVNHETAQPEDSSGNIYPTIDGADVDAANFRTFYQALIGISIDVDVKDYTITEEPLVTITYVFNTGEENGVTRYYPYNENFYAVQIGDSPVQFLVNKQIMKSMFNYLDSLLS